MKRPLVLLLLLLSFTLSAHAEDFRTRMVIWGDSEGMVQRPGKDLQAMNESAVQLAKTLAEQNRQQAIDLILCTGDFVRFDPLPKNKTDFPFAHYWPKELLDKFYPTSGGDQEFLSGKYAYFMQNFRPELAKQPYYYVLRNNIHIISLWSPDNLDEPEKHPELVKQDIFNPENIPQLAQYRWLVKTLWQIRGREDQRPIVILSHRPVLNRAGKHLLDLFDAFDVDLVLSGDTHVFAKQTYRGVNYVVTGIMGDYIGGCDLLNEGYQKIPHHEFTQYTGRYETCYPKWGRNMGKGKVRRFDHYLDAEFSPTQMKIEFVRLKDLKKDKDFQINTTLVREEQSKLQKDYLRAIWMMP